MKDSVAWFIFLVLCLILSGLGALFLSAVYFSY